MNKKKFIQILPILILGGILIYTWFIIITTDYFATIKHQIGLGVFLAILAFYFLKFKYGIFFTGIYLLLASFNIIAIFPVIISSSYFVKVGGMEISTPPIQWKAVLLLILFLICTGRYLNNLYVGYKNKRDETGL
ncbi:hypothetical protein [Arachidicoccus sp.]|uniref:hypothetical protein n=1 Tax=Arachidicoccus sp. TaxID=1872624 RepID=UPI003D1C417F